MTEYAASIEVWFEAEDDEDAVDVVAALRGMLAQSDDVLQIATSAPEDQS